ncbi:hypothetical protein [Candidatus Neptunichlamydia sp. REUL1]|uniref:hypothetical protein n=1 Tax=Candidatus Neptunichlamydia sp. REUL1 TaxID=3064277 RepID=UPI00292F720F|nr:hypothetical protein [Candidatus Neptunochlamydia sp. REUL1]
MDPFEKDPREAFQESVVTGHEKIDAVFGTEHANMYTDEAKETRDKLTTGVLPPPGGFGNQVKKSSNFFEKNIKHIFRDKPGHLSDTAANRKLLLEVAGEPNNFLGVDKYGKSWHAKIQKDGSQVWTFSQNGEIRDGGLNKTPRNFHPEAGLASPVKPGQKNGKS